MHARFAVCCVRYRALHSVKTGPGPFRAGRAPSHFAGPHRHAQEASWRGGLPAAFQWRRVNRVAGLATVSLQVHRPPAFPDGNGAAYNRRMASRRLNERAMLRQPRDKIRLAKLDHARGDGFFGSHVVYFGPLVLAERRKLIPFKRDSSRPQPKRPYILPDGSNSHRAHVQ
jgi:hypothetical protein